jgi:hypothetical protein
MTAGAAAESLPTAKPEAKEMTKKPGEEAMAARAPGTEVGAATKPPASEPARATAKKRSSPAIAKPTAEILAYCRKVDGPKSG